MSYIDSTMAKFQRTEVDYDTRTDGLPVYIGTAPVGSATSASVWTVAKLFYTASNDFETKKIAYEIKWDDRATATYG